MEKREKILVVVLAAALVLGWLGPKCWDFFQGPVDDLRSDSRELDRQLESKQQDLNITLAKLRKMTEWKARSLPPDPQVAALAYQQWLTDLTEIVVRFSELKVSPPIKPTAARNKPYTAVRVTVTGQATLMQVREFLYRFYRADILHRLTDLKLESQKSEGNPLLMVSLTAEGLALKDAPPRTATLFARAALKSEIDDSAMSIQVSDATAFPDAAPFRVRIDGEYMTVTKMDDAGWTVDRHVDASHASRHPAEAIVEWAPVRPELKDETLDDFPAIVELNPFAKPGKYEPHLEIVGQKVVRRGDAIDLKVAATGFGPKHGKPTFSLSGDIPPGLRLDANTGQFQWQQSEDLAAKAYSLTVSANAFGLYEPLTEQFDLTLQEPNAAPVIDAISPQTVYLGQPFTLRVSAKDDHTSADQLKFTLGENSPAGATIGETTGEFQWTPADGQALGDVQVTIQVSDQGEPNMTGSVTIPFTVQDDVAQYTVLTAAIAADQQRQAWLYDQSSNKRLVLREGDNMKYGGVDALVMAIGRDSITLKLDETTWQMKLGENLREVQTAIADANKKETPENADESKATAADATATSGKAVGTDGTMTESADEKQEPAPGTSTDSPAPAAASPDAQTQSEDTPNTEKPDAATEKDAMEPESDVAPKETTTESTEVKSDASDEEAKPAEEAEPESEGVEETEEAIESETAFETDEADPALENDKDESTD